MGWQSDPFLVTSNLSAVKFSRGHEHDGKMVKSVIFDKSISPMPCLPPFTFLTYCENDKLYVSTRASHMMYTDVVFGYETCFRKFDQSDEVKTYLPNFYCIKSKGIEIL